MSLSQKIEISVPQEDIKLIHQLFKTLKFFLELRKRRNENFLISKFAHSNPLHTTDISLYPLKTSGYLWFSDVFKGYRKRPVASNGLIGLRDEYEKQKAQLNLFQGKTQRPMQNPVEHLRWKRFAKIINGWKPLTIFAKRPILDVCMGYRIRLCERNQWRLS